MRRDSLNVHICEICKRDTSGLFTHTLKAEDGNRKIIVDDSCYQEISLLRNVNGKWEEYCVIGGKEYHKIFD